MINNKLKAPNWNLDSLFPSLKSNEYTETLYQYKKSLEKLSLLLNEAESGKTRFTDWLNFYLMEDEKSEEMGSTLAAFSYIIYSTDTTNSEYLNNISTIEKIQMEAQLLKLRFSDVLFSNKDKLVEFFIKYPEHEELKFLLEEILKEKEHQMSKEEENLTSDLQRTGGDAWSRLHEQLISNLHDEKDRSFNQIRSLACSSNKDERKEAWETEKRLLAQNRIAFAASLNNLKGETITLNHRRNWKEALERARFSARLSEETLNALIGAIEDSLPIWRRYLQKKAQLLRDSDSTASATSGTKKDRGLAFYDLFASLTPPKNQSCSESLTSKEWTFPQAKEYILKEYNSFSSDMGDFAKKAFDSNWIDAPVYKGKVGGAYDQDFAMGHQSRILTNFTGTFSDIITLAHELGHAYHFYCMKGKPVACFNYPMTLAETASTFAETIVKQDAIQESTGFEKINLIEIDLQDTCQVLVDILCRFYFERSVFEKREQNELNADDFCALMKEAQEKSYGEGLNQERHEYMWAVKSHYYSTDLDFYNFPYAFGQLFAAGLYERAKQEGKDFAKTYKELLSCTGSMSCEDLCKKAGFDITKKDFWKAGIKMYETEIEILEKWNY